MASDRSQFREAMAKWEDLRERGLYSRAPELGLTAIIFSQHTPTLSEDETTTLYTENTYFEREAYSIAESINAQNGDAFVIAGLDHESFEEGIMANRDVANIVVIGHGTFSSVFTDEGGSIDWLEVSSMATHLKRGYVEQRFCGKYRFRLSVPFGLFAIDSARNVLAAKGKRFSPETHLDHEERIAPITERARLSYTQVSEMFPYQPIFKDS